MKPSPPELLNSSASENIASPSIVDSIGPFSFTNKVARLLIQLAHGLAHAYRTGLPNGDESPGQLFERARRLHKLSRCLLEHFNVQPQVSGTIPESGLLISNHVSFVDIMLLSATRPVVFVSKSDVLRWPVVGPIASAAGTIYVERTRRTDVARVNAAMRHAFDAGLLVTLFPEGTSSNGASVLPFQPSLLQPAVDLGVAITPAHLCYLEADGKRADEVAYFGERDLGSCLRALVQRPYTQARLNFGKQILVKLDRKALALHLHTCVRELAPPDLQ